MKPPARRQARCRPQLPSSSPQATPCAPTTESPSRPPTPRRAQASPARRSSAARPTLAPVVHDGVRQPSRLCRAREHARPALLSPRWPPGSLSHVASTQMLPVARREIKMGADVRLAPSKTSCRRRAAAFEHVRRQVVSGPITPSPWGERPAPLFCTRT